MCYVRLKNPLDLPQSILYQAPEAQKYTAAPTEKDIPSGKKTQENGNAKDNYSVNNRLGNAEVKNFVDEKPYTPKEFITAIIPAAAKIVSPVISAVTFGSTNPKKDKKGLNIEITDINGFGDSAAKDTNDLKIKANGRLKISQESLLNAINSNSGKEITDGANLGKASFYKDDKNYYIPIKSTWDDFGLKITTEGNKLVIRTENTQLAGLKDVLGELKEKIEKAHLPFKVVNHQLYEVSDGELVNDPRLELVPDFKGTAISKSMSISSSNINEKNTKVNFDENGDLNIDLINVQMEGREVIRKEGKIVHEKSAGDSDHASITIGEEIKIKPGKANYTLGEIEVDITHGKASVELDAKESDFNINELNLGKQFSNTKINADNIHGKFILKSDKTYETLPPEIPFSDVKKAYEKIFENPFYIDPDLVEDYKEKLGKALPKKFENKITTAIADGFGADISILAQGPDRTLKINGNLNASYRNEKTVFGNKKHEDISKSNLGIKIKDTNIETNIKYKDGSAEGNKTKLDINAGVDEKVNITLQQKILETDAGIENTFNKPTTGTFEPISGSAGAFKKLIDATKKAKESISIETFLFNGDPAAELSELLVKKASEGVMVKLIIDSPFGDKKDTKGATITKDNEGDFNKGAVALTRAKESMIKKYTESKDLSPQKKKLLIENIEKNLDWRILEHGMLRIDHRKIWLIDGKEAITGGGVNLTQSAITGNLKNDGTRTHSKQDSMYETHGPVVRQLMEGFIGFWNKNSEIPMEKSETKKLLKSEKELEAEMLHHKKGIKDISISKTQVLYTDEKHKQIYQKMIEEIKHTEHTINLEHAYLDHPELQKALEDAVVSGVTVNILLPEKSDEQDFILFNNYSAIESLKKKANQPGSKGKVNAYLYKDDIAFNHSKLMTFDGKKAILGSANTTSRSLDNPVHYNKEMALYVEDENFVKNIDKNLFEKDVNESSIDLQELFNWTRNIINNQDKIDKYKNIDGAS